MLAFILQRRSDKAIQRERLVAAVRAIHSELIGNANALLTDRPDEISSANWAQYSGRLAGADRIGAAVFPWSDLDNAYAKLRTIAARRDLPSSEFASTVQELADKLLDIADRAFDVHFTLPMPPTPSAQEIQQLSPGLPTASVELPVSEAVERAIASRRLGRRRRVRRELKGSSVMGLGAPAGDTSIPGQGTRSDLIHTVIESRGRDYVILPIFTRGSYLASALQMNRDWWGTEVLMVEGGALLKNLHTDVNLSINPWSPDQFIVPAKKRRDQLR